MRYTGSVGLVLSSVASPSPTRRALCLALLTAGLATPAAALDPARKFNEYALERWGEERGLPQNTVQVILQSRAGYLWLGTGEGLVRFDGLRFEVFVGSSVEGLGSDDIRALAEAPNGDLWIGTYTGGLTRVRQGSFQRIGLAEGLASGSVEDLSVDNKGRVWIAARDRGLYVWGDDRLTQVPLPRCGTVALSVLAGPDDTVVVGTNDGLATLGPGGADRGCTRRGLPSPHVVALARHPDGTILVGTASGLGEIRGGAARDLGTAEPLFSRPVQGVTVDRGGTIWVGTDRGLVRMGSGAPPERLGAAEGLSAGIVAAVLEDREGSLWIGIEGGGLNRLRDPRAVTYGARHGITDEHIYALDAALQGGLWLTTSGGFVYHFRDGRAAPLDIPDNLRSLRLRGVREDRTGTLWIGLGNGVLRMQQGRFTRLGREQGVPELAVRALIEDREGALWVGTDGGGVTVLKDGRARTYTRRDGLAGDQVRALLEDTNGTLWVGAYGGLSHLVDGTFQSLTERDGLASNFVRSLYEDREGTLWIGTYGGGLSALRDGRITTFRKRDGLYSDVIFSIIEDDDGNLWMSCNQGIFRLPKRELADFASGKLDRLRCVAYGRAEGMVSQECNGGDRAVLRTDDGTLWFPTVKGLVAIDPRREQINRLQPPVVIERVTVNGMALPPGTTLEVPPGARRIEIEYAGLSFIAPERMRFAVKLTGFDPDWVQVGPRRVAAFSRLPPGRYRFQVKAANSDGVWNEQGAEITLVQRPFFYQTRLFYVLAALGTVLLGVAIQQGRVRRLRARARDLMGQVDAALAKIKVLSGLLPICAWCKKIRDDHGQWNQMETFIRNRSEAEFTHGICPECMSRIASEKLGPPAGPDPGPVE